MSKTEEKCACANCANPACNCSGNAPRAQGECCCGPACQCGEACKCLPSCGCPATAKR